MGDTCALASCRLVMMASHSLMTTPGQWVLENITGSGRHCKERVRKGEKGGGKGGRVGDTCILASGRLVITDSRSLMTTPG